MYIDTNLLEIMSSVGTIVTPILVLMLSAVGWKYRQSMERRIRIEEKLRIDRVEIYNFILEPFVIALMSDETWNAHSKTKNKNKQKVMEEKMFSTEYRKKSFQLALVGSDDVVNAFNNLMQYFYNNGEGDGIVVYDFMSYLGQFLLEIRKSMGNEETALNEFDMLEWFITDIDKIREQASA